MEENPMERAGSAYIGAIARTKFHYDGWGDTVNGATSCMEPQGQAGKIQIAKNL